MDSANSSGNELLRMIAQRIERKRLLEDASEGAAGIADPDRVQYLESKSEETYELPHFSTETLSLDDLIVPLRMDEIHQECISEAELQSFMLPAPDFDEYHSHSNRDHATVAHFGDHIPDPAAERVTAKPEIAEAPPPSFIPLDY